MTLKTKVMAAALGVAASAAAAVHGALVDRSPAVVDGPRVTVLAELFTSEGCSSCPPADALLRDLATGQPLPGVEVVALSNHVDYWDHLGWRDPFSSPVFSERQSAYDAAVFRSDSIYTPQLVVDGFLQAVGSDAAAVKRLLRQAAREPKGSVQLSVTTDTDTKLTVSIHAELPANVRRHGAADLMIAVAEDGLTTRVARGENHGRTLAHDGVVRRLTRIAALGKDQHELALSASVPLDRAWRRESLRIVGFVQEKASRRVLAVGSLRITASPGAH